MEPLTPEQREANAAAYEKRQALEYTAKTSECSACGRTMQVMIWAGEVTLRCQGDQQHEGYRKRRSLTELAKSGIYIPYVSERVERMKEKQMEELAGPEGRELAVYGTTAISMTPTAAERIIGRLWPKATAGAREMAMLISVQYNLNPLNKEVYIIPFKEQEVVVLGIEAHRKIARRRTPYTYADGPRPLTADELEAMGEDSKKNIGVLCVLETPSGGRFPGYGFWPRATEPYGSDKGNTKFNMASYRAERNALKRLMPDAELPAPVGMVIEGMLGDVTEIMEVPASPPAPAQRRQEKAGTAGPPQPVSSPSQAPKPSPAPSQSEQGEIQKLMAEAGLTLEQLTTRTRAHFGIPDLMLGPRLTQDQREWVLEDLQGVIESRRKGN